MKRSVTTVLCLWATVLVVPIVAIATEAPAEDGPERLRPIADGVYVALQDHERRFDDCNVTVVVRSDHVLIVDAPSDRAFLDTVVSDLRQLTDLPVRYVVNTHWHGDHTQGNAAYLAAFGDGVTVIGHETLAEDIPDRAAKDHAERVARFEEQIPKAREALAQGLGLSGQTLDPAQQDHQREAIESSQAWLDANRDVRFELPSLTYRTRLVLDDAAMPVVLIHAQAHTRGDTLVHLPKASVLIAGDVVDAIPYAGHGYPAGWLATLDRIRDELAPKQVVPGHGSLFTLEAVVPLHGFFETLVSQTKAAVDRQDDLETARKAVDVAVWRRKLAGDDARAQRFFDGVLGEAIERAYAEATGELAED